MLIYNATYQVDFADARNFVIWIHQVYIPKVLEHGMLKKPRLCKVLSHHDADSECFSLQFEVADSAILQRDDESIQRQSCRIHHTAGSD